MRVKKFLAAALTLCLAGCSAVNENALPETDTVYIAPAETAAETVTTVTTAAVTAAAESITVSITTDDTTESTKSVTTESITESDITESTVAVSTESTTTENITESTDVSVAAVVTAEKLTLQQESPPETVVQTVSTARTAAGNSYQAVNFDEQKGFWITYLEYGSILKGKSEASFRKSIGGYFDNISGLGFNTVYVQVRAFGDAYYDSELFPSGEQYTGTIGSGASFDALQVMVEEAHSRGMSIHAWVNPMRLMTTAQLENIDSGYTVKKWYSDSSKRGKYLVKSGDRWYLNPAYSAVTDLIADGVSEIVQSYKVDGIQIDDYFYPTVEKSFDSAAYSASGTSLSLADWRVQNVNKMVKKLYSAVHSGNNTAVFGISPQGSVENNYNELFADVRTWCAQSGYCDYILPQVYFGFENGALPYKSVIKEWSGMVTSPDVQLVIGLAAYKIGAADSYAGSGKNEWLQRSDIISRQMALAGELPNYGGVALYRYESLFAPSSEAAAQVNKELDNIRRGS